ncbi:uncharacterized protein LOC121838442 [Ixodes scapularis]|uniref:uncharacterized protein LOC121838442 n=1 Tax=Ixodes scapularis TaxID=6945 RepID=UPI001C37E8C7|nr:uncharacterized protein LOC121838442 [Ixodes scapularis]
MIGNDNNKLLFGGATLRPSDLSGDISVDESSRTDGSREEIVDFAPFTSQLASINATLNQLLSLRTSVETLLPVPSKVDQLLALKPAVEELRNTVQGLQTTVDSFSLKYDSVLALAMTNEEAVKELQKEVNTVKATMRKQSETIERLKDELNDMQQYSRRSNMELHGFPLSHGEDLMKVISDLARPLNLPTPQSSDILAIHRLTKKPDSVPVILIRFASVTLKDAWMAARGRLHRLCQSENQPKLFFNDNLTSLFYKRFGAETRELVASSAALTRTGGRSDDMKRVRTKRTARRGQTTRLIKEVSTVFSNEAYDLKDLILLHERLSRSSEELKTLNRELEQFVADGDLEQEHESVMNYEDQVASALVTLIYHTDRLKCSQAVAAPPATSEATERHRKETPTLVAKLPKLEMLKFDGRIGE